MLLYTGQRNTVALVTIENGQTYFCTHCMEMELDEDYSMKAGYQWIMDTMEEHGIRKPEGAKYPVWLTPHMDMAQDFNNKVMVFDIPETELLITNSDIFGFFASVDCFDAECIKECLNLEEDSYIQATAWCLKPEWFKGTI